MADCIVRNARRSLSQDQFDHFLHILLVGTQGNVSPVVAENWIRTLVIDVDIFLERDLQQYFAWMYANNNSGS